MINSYLFRRHGDTALVSNFFIVKYIVMQIDFCVEICNNHLKINIIWSPPVWQVMKFIKDDNRWAIPESKKWLTKEMQRNINLLLNYVIHSYQFWKHAVFNQVIMLTVKWSYILRQSKFSNGICKILRMNIKWATPAWQAKNMISN